MATPFAERPALCGPLRQPRQMLADQTYDGHKSIHDDAMAADLGLPALNPAEDRVMICGSPEMLRDLKHMLEKRGFMEGNTTKPGDFVIERAFAEQ